RAMAKDPTARYPTAAAFAEVARRAGAGLASGTGVAVGPAGAPVSGPPVPSPTSPGPAGTGSVPRPPTTAPGGTRVMASYPPTGRQTPGQPRASATAPLVSARCDVVSKGPTFEQTRDYLEGQGFKINREEVPGPRNRVVEVTPCEAPRGSTITVKVGNGQRGG